jgi:integrase
MTPLCQALDDYLTMRRGLGYKLERAEKLLVQFLAYLDEVGADNVTVEHALAWGAASRRQRSELVVAAALGRARLRRLPAHARSRRRGTGSGAAALATAAGDALPLYTDAEIAALLAACTSLRFPLRVATYRTLIGLLAVTGLRVGEAIRLDRGDLDLERGLLLVRDSKFGKSRELPLHATVVRALRGYLRRRQRLQPRPQAEALLVSLAGTRLRYCNVNWTFLRLVRRAGLEPRSATCRPRLHDLRHSFAVRTVLDAYRADSDVQARLPLLSTYLGHVDPAATYWYLSAALELLALAGQRLERHLETRP